LTPVRPLADRGLFLCGLIAHRDRVRDHSAGQRLNYFAHAIRFLEEDPYFLAGTAVPDWMAVADRPVRVRAKLAQQLIDSTSDPVTRSVARGALRHLEDDDWFHATAAFVEVSSDLARRFRAFLGPDHPAQCGFLGHIVTELLIDSELDRRHPGRLQTYYQQLDQIDPLIVEAAVNQMARGETARLRVFIPLFRVHRFLFDYAEDHRLLARLNGVMHRVKLEPLPANLLSELATARGIVRDRIAELLPPEHFGGLSSNITEERPPPGFATSSARQTGGGRMASIAELQTRRQASD
jgi:hypothetical protein